MRFTPRSCCVLVIFGRAPSSPRQVRWPHDAWTRIHDLLPIRGTLVPHRDSPGAGRKCIRKPVQFRTTQQGPPELGFWTSKRRCRPFLRLRMACFCEINDRRRPCQHPSRGHPFESSFELAKAGGAHYRHEWAKRTESALRWVGPRLLRSPRGPSRQE